MTRDTVLPLTNTCLWSVDDRSIVPAWINYPAAFSAGEEMIASGAFWLLWSLGGPNKV